MPLDRLAEAIAATVEIGARHGLPACSWGHAGDGNLHSTLPASTRGEAGTLERAEAAAEELFELALALGGTISGEHGIGLGQARAARAAARARRPAARRRDEARFDPKSLLNPGKG